MTFQDVHLRESPHVSQSELEQVFDRGQTPPDIPHIPFAVRQGLFLRGRVGSVAEARERLHGVSGASGRGGDFVGLVVNTLADVNGFLEPHGLHFAYRVRDEALRFCANSFEADGTPLLVSDTELVSDTLASDIEGAPEGLMNLRTALDLQLLQKVLPRLTGTQEQLELPLADLLRYAERQAFERTAHRLRRLQTILQRDGFAGFDAA